MTRFWQNGQPIQVLMHAEIPTGFIWRKQRHHIQFVAQHWRVDIGWWRIRIWRDYYKVTTDTHLLVVIYHNLIDNSWYVQQLYD